jgi:hypothetical protein
MAVTLSLQKLAEADPSRGWAPTEFYDIVAAGKVVGSIQLRWVTPTTCVCMAGMWDTRSNQNIVDTATQGASRVAPYRPASRF